MDEGSTTGVADDRAKPVRERGPVEAQGVVAYIRQQERIWGEDVVRYDLKAVLIAPDYPICGSPAYVAWASRRGRPRDVVVEVGECHKGIKVSTQTYCGQVYADIGNGHAGKIAPMYLHAHDAVAGLRKTLDGRHGRAGEPCDDRGNIYPSTPSRGFNAEASQPRT